MAPQGGFFIFGAVNRRQVGYKHGMYFTLSKTVGVLTQPSALLVIGLTIGLVLMMTRFRLTGRMLTLVSMLVLWAASVLPLGESVIRRLEDRFPIPVSLPADVGGVIALGGGIDPHLSRARAQLSVGGSVERPLFMKHLATRYPAVPIIYSGGSGSLFDQDAREADYFSQLAGLLGWDAGRILLEGRSRNTLENARFSRELVPPGAAPWILITSARHMPRAMGIFRRQGWNVIAYPVDYLTEPAATRWMFGFDPAHGLGMLDAAFHEVAGLIAARLLGHSDAFFPAPR